MERADRKRPRFAPVINPFFDGSIAFHHHGIAVMGLFRKAKHEEVLVVTSHVPGVTSEFSNEIMESLTHLHMVSQWNIDFMRVIHSSHPNGPTCGSLPGIR